MRNFIFAIFVVLLVNLSVSCRPISSDTDDLYTNNTEPVNNASIVDIERFADILTLDPEWIDIADACFFLEIELGWADNNQRVQAELILQMLEDKVSRKIRSYDDGERRVKKLISEIFESGFRVDKDDPYGHNPENLYLSSVLTRRRGYCLSLSYVALAVSQRLKRSRNLIIPVCGVRAPKHFFIRYVSKNKGLEKNFEMTNYGAIRDKFDYLKMLDLPLAYVNSPPYFRTLDNKRIFSDMLNNIGGNFILTDDYPKAKTWLQNAMKFDDINPQPYYNLAYVYEKQKDFSQAIKNLSKAINLDANFYEALIARGRLYCELGNPKEGLKDFEFAIENYKYRHEAFLMRGVHFAKIEEYNAALTDFKRAKKLNPLDKDTNTNLLNLYLRQNMLDEASEIVDILRKISPEDLQAKKLIEIYESLKHENK